MHDRVRAFLGCKLILSYHCVFCGAIGRVPAEHSSLCWLYSFNLNRHVQVEMHFALYTPCLSVVMLRFKVWSLGVDLSFDLRQSTSSGLSFCCFRLRQVSCKPRQAQTHIHTHTSMSESKKLPNVKGGAGGICFDHRRTRKMTCIVRT